MADSWTPRASGAAEANQVAAFLQGFLMGGLVGDRAEGRLPLKVASIDATHTPDGHYQDHFFVTTESGIKLRVTVTPESQ